MERSALRFKKKTIAHKECKIATHFFFFFANFALLAGFFLYLCYYLYWSRDSLFPVCRIVFPLYITNQVVEHTYHTDLAVEQKLLLKS